MVVQHSDHASEDQVQSRQWAVLRAFMDPKEAALLDSLLSSRTLNPDITVFPLHFAAAEGDLGTIKKLLEKPHAKSGNTLSKVRETFDVNQSFMDLPRGSTPLQWAAAKQYTSIVSYLLSKGANVNQPTRKGQTALHLACAVNHLETIQKLVHSGADTEARDEAGKTPIDHVFTGADTLNDKDKQEDPIYVYLSSQLSKAHRSRMGKATSTQRSLSTMQATLAPDEQQQQQQQQRAQRLSSSHATHTTQTSGHSHKAGRPQAGIRHGHDTHSEPLVFNDSVDEDAQIKMIVGPLVAHEVAIVMGPRGDLQGLQVFRLTRRTLMGKRLGLLALALEVCLHVLLSASV